MNTDYARLKSPSLFLVVVVEKKIDEKANFKLIYLQTRSRLSSFSGAFDDACVLSGTREETIQ